MYGVQIQTTTFDERMSSRTSVKGREGIAYGLNCVRCQSSTLTNVEVHETIVVFISTFDGLPNTVLVSDTTLGQRIHCFVRNVLAIVEAQ